MAQQFSKQSILHLYRQCLKSAKKIPDPSQRAVYWEYVSDGFRVGRQRHVAQSRPAFLAVQDAQEQLERMDYYHSIREDREESQQQQQQQQGDALSPTGAKIRATTSLTSPNHTTTDPPTYSTSDGSSSSLKKSFTTSNSNIEDKKQEVVKYWLQSRLPDLYSDDLDVYAGKLVDDGFDSKSMLEKELDQGDLQFMKKAHRRSLWKIVQQDKEVKF